MSAKGRGEALDPTGQDYYPTPAWCTRALAAVYKPPPGVLFDPCCGDGAIIQAWSDREWYATDVRSEAVETLKQNTFSCSFTWVGDCRTIPAISDGVGAVITNPPYGIAASIIKWALDRRGPRTDVVMLLRLPWMCAKKDREWLKQCAPDVGILTDRPKFRENGKGKTASDMADYGWFLWPAGAPRTEGRLFYCPDESEVSAV